MASNSRAAQEQLANLEKASAPFIDQLNEAAKFIGEDLEIVGRSSKNLVELGKPSKAAAYHGREEWLLRWLLKKLQAPKDSIPRQHHESWWLLGHLIRNVPLTVVARLLVERKFTNILRQTLDEAGKRSKEISAPSTSTEEPVSEPKKSSKKRKRTPSLTDTPDTTSSALLLQLQALHAVLDFITASTEPVVGLSEASNELAFTAEYMKTTIRTTAEEAAVIFGLWLSLSPLLRESAIPESRSETWISPFIELWQARISTEHDLTLFSIHCTKPLLQLLGQGQGNWKEQLEQVVARNIIIPARSDYIGTLEATLLTNLTKISIIQDSANAPILFDIATRSIQSNGSKRRKPQDDIWLQTAFISFQEAFLPQRHEENCKALGLMLQTAIHFKVNLNLPVLRKATSEFALPEGRNNWKLVADFLKLDGNVFLIPDAEENLLDKLLSHITTLSLEKEWESVGDQIVLDVLVPLMDEFAKARDLTGFIRHWFAQLITFEKLRKDRPSSIGRFSAWEDDALQDQLNKLFEPSLTSHQITQTLDWLSSEVELNPEAVCVLLQAIAGAISKEELVDEIKLRLYHIMFDNGVSDKLDERYKWRSLSIISRTLGWAVGPAIDEAASLCNDLVKPFDSLLQKGALEGSQEAVGPTRAGFYDLEALRCVCALWSAAETGSLLERIVKNTMLDYLNSLAEQLNAFPRRFIEDHAQTSKVCGVRQNTLSRGLAWEMWSMARCVFVEYPKSLALGPEMEEKETFNQLLKSVHSQCLASQPRVIALQEYSGWHSNNSHAYPDLWLSAIQQDVVLNSPVIVTMIDIMLKNDSYFVDPSNSMEVLNTLAYRALLQLPLDVFSKKNRESIMKKWMSDSSGSTRNVVVDPAVLSLKIKVMNRPTFYEGMSFQDLVKLANHLTHSSSPSPSVGLSLFKQLVRLILCQMSENMEQSRNKAYITTAISDMKKMLKNIESKKKGKEWSYPLITLFDVTLGVLRSKSASMADLDIISASKYQKLITSFKESLLPHLEVVIAKLTKNLSKDSSSGKTEHSLSLLCILDALPTLGVTNSEIVGLQEPAKVLTQHASFVSDDELETGKKLENFIITHSVGSEDGDLVSLAQGDVSTAYGRQAISEKVHAALLGKDQSSKLTLLASLFESEFEPAQLDRLLALRHLIASCGDTRRPSDDDDEDDSFNISAAYSILCTNMWKVKGFRQFSLISETMELMLRTKGRSMSQWNIDSTLGSITIMCSRNGPSVHANRAGTVYLHLCHLLQAVLTSHRIKLQGHFHLVVQVLQTLLRCLFVPLPHSTTKTTKFMAPPPWLSSQKHQLSAKHAVAFTRLVTLICDPSVSSVTRSQHNNLTSATNKAKGMAAQHMQLVLTTYIKLQLEMRMLPEIREKMIPGLYAIFDTTTPEMRRMINESLDSSGRSVFGTLFRDYQRFGKWKG